MCLTILKLILNIFVIVLRKLHLIVIKFYKPYILMYKSILFISQFIYVHNIVNFGIYGFFPSCLIFNPHNYSYIG